MKFASVLAAAVLCMSSVDAKRDKCRALAMSGGGAKGAYEAGVLWGLVNNSNDTDTFAWDVVTGVSIGACNTGGLVMFKPGDERSMVSWLSDFWSGTVNSDLYVNWSPLGIVTGVLSKQGVYDVTPGLGTLNKVFDEFGRQVQRLFTVSCVDSNSGAYVLFNETISDPAKAIISSASIPGVFKPEVWPNYGKDGADVACMDGGTVWNTNLVSAIDLCHDLGYGDDDIILDVIECDSFEMAPWDHRNDAISNHLRYQDIKTYNDNTNDIYEFLQAFPNVTFRYYIGPSEPLPSGLNLLNFDNETNTWPMQMLGRLDGENAIKDGEGMMFSKFKEWGNNATLQAEYPKLGAYMQKNILARAEVHKQERRHQTWCESPTDPLCANEAEPAGFFQ